MWHLAGVHLEGPFIAKEKKGAHPEHLIRDFNNGVGDLTAVYGRLDNVAMVTLAAEKPNSSQVIHELTWNHNITVSLGE